MNSQDNDEGFGNLLRGTADAAGRLLASHLELARLELIEGASKIARPASAVALFAILTTIGYALLVLGIAAWLQPKLGWAVALLLLGTPHILLGGVGTLLALRRFEALQLTSGTDLRNAESMTTLPPGVREPLTLEELRAS
jgi:Putative Actinobacterial Holin-X, holin superfamily III